MANLLIIDDESNIRMMLRLALEHVGHTVELASDGYEGLGKFGDGRAWDLVLLDHRMPDMTGIEVLHALRRRQADCRVVMITAFGTVDLATTAIQAGATDFLRKPFTIEVLRETVTSALATKPTTVPPLSVERVRVNGFQLVTLPGLERLGDGTLSKTFSVQRSEGAGRACRVSLLPSLQAQVPALASPPEASFWEALCGEALANYLWQNAVLPPGGLLVVEELTTGLRRWIESQVPSVEAASVPRTRGELEGEVASATVKFQREQQGRGPTDVRAHVVGELLLVRSWGIFTPTETNLAASEQGRRLIKSSRIELRSINHGEIEAILSDLVGQPVVRSYYDLVVEAAEQVEVYVFAESLERRFPLRSS